MQIRSSVLPLLLLAGGVASAQGALAAAPAPDGAEDELVTGSRLPRPGGAPASPVLVLTRQQLLDSGARSLGEFLQARPELGVGWSSGQVNNGNDGTVGLGLRSLGEARTLVLLNGRRFVPGGRGFGGTGAIAIVDVLALPVAAVERIEVLLDGASAVYGSGAIAGVVNVITRSRLDGTEVSASAGRTSRGDGATYDLSAITGTGGERGGLLFSLGLQRQEPIRAGDRTWSRQTYGWNFELGQEETVVGNSGTTPDGRFSLPAGVPSAPGAACDALPAGDPVKALCALPGTSNDFIPNGDGTFRRGAELYNTYPGIYLVTPSQRIQLFVSGDVRLGGAARASLEATYANRTSAQNLAPMPVVMNSSTRGPISADSMYNPLGVDITNWRRRTAEFGDRSWRQDLDTLELVLGLDGALGAWAGPLEGWRWEGAYTFGRTTGLERSDGLLWNDRIGAAVGPSFLHPVQGPVCGDRGPDGVAGTADDRIVQGCVPMDVLGGAGTLTPAMKASVGYQGTSYGSSDLQVAAASLRGPLGRLWSPRPAALSVGAEFRHEAARILPDPVIAAGLTTGTSAYPAIGRFDAIEGYGEAVLPILSGVEGVRELELSVAARAVRSSTFGSDTAWQAALRYAPVQDVVLRGGYATAFRAPGIRELYGSERYISYDFVPFGDPCADPASAPATCGAAAGNGDQAVMFTNHKLTNPDLKPERAEVLTLGATVTPRWVPDLEVTLGYQVIDLTGTVGHRGSAVILAGCYFQGNARDCAAIVRDAQGIIVSITDPLWNIGGARTAALDAGVRYSLEAGPAGRFTVALAGTFLRYHRLRQPDGSVLDGQGNYDLGLLPAVKGNTSVGWSLGGLGAVVTGRYVGSFMECEFTVCSLEGLPQQGQRTVPAWLGLDLSLSYRLRTSAGSTTLAAGILNLLDAPPPKIYTAASFSADPGYPFAGRAYHARLTQSF